MKLSIIDISPVIITVLVLVAACYFGGNFVSFSIESGIQIGGTIASISMSVLSLLLAALAILVSISHTSLLQALRKSNHFLNLLISLFISCIMFLLCASLGFYMLFGNTVSAIFINLIYATHIGALLSITVVGWKFWKVLSANFNS